ncbi:MAG TPA: YhfX family PLP-dependent enzyme [Tepiditoga sp.]|nr:YhfX family PLP-dependent enzyme [Tepiditoga sp.]
MFLEKTLKRNPGLIKTAFELHQGGKIQPDTYIIDLYRLTENALKIKKEADKYGIKLYFMTKQIGRNPLIAKRLMDIGYAGAVAVDFREAGLLGENGIKLGNIGHLVQIPDNDIKKLVEMNPEIITVYSMHIIEKINAAAAESGKIQDVMIRVISKDDMIYAGQYGGIYLDELEDFLEKTKQFKNVRINGLTVFPAFLYDKDKKDIEVTKNTETLKKAMLTAEKKGLKIEQINTPSATCVQNIKKIKEIGGTHGEPGHGLTGTTPMHAEFDMPETPAIVYVSEISHNLGESSYIYGGGHYRRSRMENIFIGKDINNFKKSKIKMPDSESIDYYIETEGNYEIGDTAVLAFRTQIFVTRSRVAVVEGISENQPIIAGIFDSQGNEIRR